MLIRGETTEDRIAKIAQGFGQGFQNMQQGMDRQRQQSLQAEAQRRQQAMQALEIEAKLSETTGRDYIGSGAGESYMTGNGLSTDLAGTLKPTLKAEREQAALVRQQEKDNRDRVKFQREEEEASKPLEETRDYKKSMAVAGVRAQTQENMYLKRQEGEKQQKIDAVKIQGFDIADPAIIPSAKDAETVKSQSASNKTFQQMGTTVASRIEKSNPRDPTFYISNEWKEIQRDLTKMKLQAKNLEDLGVLNGPDLGLVNETLGSITPFTLAQLGPKAAAQRISGALQNSQKVLDNVVSSRGYKPKMSAEDAELAELAALRAKAGL